MCFPAFSCLPTRKKYKKANFTFGTFQLKRAARLLPLVAIAAVVYEGLLFVYNRLYPQPYCGLSVSVWGIVIDALGVQEGWVFANPCVNNPTWYISVLLLCCAVFYLLTRLAGKKKFPAAYLYAAMILLGCGIQEYQINLPLLNPSSCRGYYAFFTGLLLAQALKGRQVKSWVGIGAGLTVAAGVLLFAAKGMVSGTPYLLTFIVFPALIVLLHTKTAQKIFRFRFFGVWGALSYDVYIWHSALYIAMYILMKVLNWNLDFSNVWVMLGFCAAAEAVGAVSYFVLEKPLNRAATKLLKRLISAPRLSGGEEAKD
ncbi:MAG: acyltransferase [Eubacteriales bacterium]|nr:acyltransferase [Eubacteriales bacterium]